MTVGLDATQAERGSQQVIAAMNTLTSVMQRASEQISNALSTSTTQTTRNLDRMSTSIKSLTDTLKPATNAVSSFAKELLGLLGLTSLFSLGGAVAAFQSISTSMASLGRTASGIGETARGLSTLQAVARAFGGTAEDATRSIGGLAGALARMRMFGEVSPVIGAYQSFLRRAIGPNEKPQALMEEALRDMEQRHLAMPERVAWGEKLGIAPALAQSSRAGRERVAAQTAQFAPSDEEVKRFQQFNEQLEIGRYAMGALFEKIAAALAPALTDLVSKLTPLVQKMVEWVKANQDWLKEKFVEAIEAVWNFLKGLPETITQIVTELNKWKEWIKLFAEAWVAYKIASLFIGVLTTVGSIGAGLASWPALIALVGTAIVAAGIIEMGKAFQKSEDIARSNAAAEGRDQDAEARQHQQNILGGVPSGGAGGPSSSSLAPLGSAIKNWWQGKGFRPTAAPGGTEAYTPGGPWGHAGPLPPPIQTVKVTSKGGQTWNVAPQYAERFQGLITDLDAQGINLKSAGGYNRRFIGGTNMPSAHAYGAAIDVNSATNMQGTQGDLPPEVAEIAAKHGLYWGGLWHGKTRDPMHFEVMNQPVEGTPGAQGTMSGWAANNPLNLTRRRDAPGATTAGGLPIRSYGSMEEGVADSVRKLVEYQQQRHLYTVDAMAKEWNKTSTPEYVNAIARGIGVRPQDKIDMTDPKVAAAWIRAAQPKETGPGRLSEEQIAGGVSMGLGQQGPRSIASRAGAGAAASGRMQMSQNTSHSTNIGNVHVYTQANDAGAVAKDLSGHLRKYMYVNQANYGLA